MNKKRRFTAFSLMPVLIVFLCISPLNGSLLFASDRAPIDVNLIIDGSSALLDAKQEITDWVCGRLDQILMQGDRITVWSAAAASRIIYSGTINSDADKDAVKTTVRDLQGSGNSADFSGALREASARQSSTFSYTLLISASPAALSSVIESPQASLLRFSRIEEFSSWRALVVGLNLDAKVRRAAAAFFNP